MDQTKTLEVLGQLERRISHAVEMVTALRSECRTIKSEKTNLEDKIKELKAENIELSNHINDLKIQREKIAGSFNREEVRKKIDHVLEKFGELQL
ncbi:MAG: cell division protein ZapB [Candidatus Krumholzibacteria bacterium]|nr:cell division protein ZapB [Candidatus Krumholzibacteria bacterium]